MNPSTDGSGDGLIGAIQTGINDALQAYRTQVASQAGIVVNPVTGQTVNTNALNNTTLLVLGGFLVVLLLVVRK